MTGRRRTAAGAGGPRRGGRALSRRQLLAGSGMATAAVVTASTIPASGADTPTSGPTNGSTVPFYGEHQAGVVTPAQDRMVFATYDVTASDAHGLGALLENWTEAAARMTAGQELDGPGGDFAPPPDTGEALDLSPSRLTVTVGFGPSLFDDRFGLRSRRPAALIDLPAFPGDELDPTRSGGDLCIQACADDPQVAFHAVHDLTRLALGSATVRSLQVGFGRTAATGAKTPSPRNLLGFRDGTDNLVSTDSGSMDRFVWVDDRTDQPWMSGGTYLVARRIRIHLEAWDRSTLGEQERTIGRIKSTGAPLGGSASTSRSTSAPWLPTAPSSSPTTPTSGSPRPTPTTARRSCGGGTASQTASTRSVESSMPGSSSSASRRTRRASSSRSSSGWHSRTPSPGSCSTPAAASSPVRRASPRGSPGATGYSDHGGCRDRDRH